MKRFTRMIAVGSASLALASVASAQFGSPQPGVGTSLADLSGGGGAGLPLYDFHWHSAAGSPSATLTAGFLWPFFNSNMPNVGGPGDAIRLCYGIDVSQGGRNWSGPGATAPGPWSGSTAVPSGGMTENTWFRWAQSFAPVNASVDIGLVSVQAGTTSARGGDNCFTPFFKGFSHMADSGGHKIGALAVIGPVAGTSVAAFPVTWEFTFAWGPTPVLLPNKIGDDSSDPGIPAIGAAAINTTGIAAPLLSNIIYEVQAPVNGPGNNTAEQYYLASTVEFTGINAFPGPGGLGYIGTGGVSNGNGNVALDIFSTPPTTIADAGATNATAYSRVITAAPGGGFINEMPAFALPVNQPGPPFSTFRNGRFEFTGQIATATPKLWAYHNFRGISPLGQPASFSALGAGHMPPPSPPPLPLAEGLDGNNSYLLFTGAGGPDWQVSASGAPLSRIDIIAIDHDTGAEAALNVYAKVGSYLTTTPTSMLFTPNGPYAHAPVALDTSLGASGGTTFYGIPLSCKAIALTIFNWSLLAPGALPHPQQPGMIGFDLGSLTWTDGQPSNPFGPAITAKEGIQVLPHGTISGDPLFGLFATMPSLTLSTGFSASDDFFADGALDYGGNIFPSFSSIFQGMFTAETSGQADFPPPGRQQFVGFPDMSLPGLQFNLSGLGLGLDICTSGIGMPIPIANEVYNALTISLQ